MNALLTYNLNHELCWCPSYNWASFSPAGGKCLLYVVFFWWFYGMWQKINFHQCTLGQRYLSTLGEGRETRNDRSNKIFSKDKLYHYLPTYKAKHNWVQVFKILMCSISPGILLIVGNEARWKPRMKLHY